MRIQIWKLKKKIQFNFLSTSRSFDVLKRTQKTIWENAFEQKKKKPGLTFNLGLALTSLRTTGPTGNRG